MQFAAGVAAGKPLVTAYREVYKPAHDKAPSVYQNAKRAARHPQIAAQVKALETQLLPGPADVAKIWGHALSVAIRLSVSSQDDRVRLKAATWLYQEAEKWEALEAARPRDQREEVLSELRGLYEKAFSKPVPPSLVEVVDEGVSAEEPEGTPDAEGFDHPLELWATEEEGPPDPTTIAGRCKDTCAAPPRQYIMALVTPPGHFPPKFKRVPA
jgi:hypothetical protein